MVPFNQLSIEESVSRGEQWLDEHYPDWPKKIKLNKLSLCSPCNCILGQVDGRENSFLLICEQYCTYSTGEYFKTWQSLKGFARPAMDDPPDGNLWDVMNEIWKERIRSRLKATA